MPTHITPQPRAGQTGPEAGEPARRASRFDERGIALQTVIIMVVLLAIAGAIAAVLFSRASDVTADLENQDVSAGIDTATECTNHAMGDKYGSTTATAGKCTWQDDNAQNDEVTRGRCTLVGGEFKDRDGTATNDAGAKCEVTL